MRRAGDPACAAVLDPTVGVVLHRLRRRLRKTALAGEALTETILLRLSLGDERTGGVFVEAVRLVDNSTSW